MTETPAAPSSTDAARRPTVLDARALVGHMLEDLATLGSINQHGSFDTPTPDTKSQPQKRSPEDTTREKVSAVANRLALQVLSVPSLQAFLADYGVVDSGKSDGSIKIQLDFLKLPKEIIPDLERLLSVDQFHSHRLVKYIKNGQARTGLEIEVVPSELPGDAYTYAY